MPDLGSSKLYNEQGISEFPVPEISEIINT